MKIYIEVPTTESLKERKAVSTQLCMALMQALHVKREPAISLIEEIRKQTSIKLVARKALLSLVPYQAPESNEISFKVTSRKQFIKLTPRRSNVDSAVKIRADIHDRYANITSINNRGVELKLKRIQPKLSKQITPKLSYLDKEYIRALERHQGIFLRDYAHIISILHTETVLNKSASTNLRRIKEYLKKTSVNKSQVINPIRITEFIKTVNYRDRYYYLISNQDRHCVFIEKGMSRKLDLPNNTDWLTILNKINTGFIERKDHLFDELFNDNDNALHASSSDINQVMINSIQRSDSFNKSQMKQWKASCDLKVLWTNSLLKGVDIFDFNGGFFGKSKHTHAWSRKRREEKLRKMRTKNKEKI